MIATSIVEPNLAGESMHGIARRLRRSDERVRHVLTNRGVELRTAGEARRLYVSQNPDRFVEKVPSPEQIAAMAAEIRRGWTPAERNKRLGCYDSKRRDSSRCGDTSRRLNGRVFFNR